MNDNGKTLLKNGVTMPLYAVLYPKKRTFGLGVYEFGSLVKACPCRKHKGEGCCIVNFVGTPYETHLNDLEDLKEILPGTCKRHEVSQHFGKDKRTGWFELDNGTRWYFYDLDKKTYQVSFNGRIMHWEDRKFKGSLTPMTHETMLSLAELELGMHVFEALRMSSYFASILAADFIFRVASDDGIEKGNLEIISRCRGMSHAYHLPGMNGGNVTFTLNHDPGNSYIRDDGFYFVEIHSENGNMERSILSKSITHSIHSLSYETALLFRNERFDMSKPIDGIEEGFWEKALKLTLFQKREKN